MLRALAVLKTEFPTLRYAMIGVGPDEARLRKLAEELKAFVKGRITPYKYPRWIEFVPELPKTVTGKIQRYKLRELA